MNERKKEGNEVSCLWHFLGFDSVIIAHTHTHTQGLGVYNRGIFFAFALGNWRRSKRRRCELTTTLAHNTSSAYHQFIGFLINVLHTNNVNKLTLCIYVLTENKKENGVKNSFFFPCCLQNVFEGGRK